MTAAAPAPPGPAGQPGRAPGSAVTTPGSGHVGSRGGRAPGLTVASAECPISRSPTHGPTCCWQTTRASPAHLRSPQRRHPAGTDGQAPAAVLFKAAGAGEGARPARGGSGMLGTGAVRERPRRAGRSGTSARRGPEGARAGW